MAGLPKIWPLQRIYRHASILVFWDLAAPHIWTHSCDEPARCPSHSRARALPVNVSAGASGGYIVLKHQQRQWNTSMLRCHERWMHGTDIPCLDLVSADGILQCLLGSLRLGVLTQLISQLVIIGFTTGSAFLIASTQLSNSLE